MPLPEKPLRSRFSLFIVTLKVSSEINLIIYAWSHRSRSKLRFNFHHCKKTFFTVAIAERISFLIVRYVTHIRNLKIDFYRMKIQINFSLPFSHAEIFFAPFIMTNFNFTRVPDLENVWKVFSFRWALYENLLAIMIRENSVNRSEKSFKDFRNEPCSI